MIYNDLLFNKQIFDQLINYYKNNKIQNAYIFYGENGIGKEAHAIEFFAAINCKNPLENFSACGICNSCIKVRSLQHELLNITLPLPRGKQLTRNDSPLKALNNNQLDELTNQLKLKGNNAYFKIKLDRANTILINSIREIKKKICLSIPDSKFRLHLILEAEKLCYPKQESANALLKILEEPTENNFFILITSDASKLIDTIKSRCTAIYFNPIELKKHYNYLLNIDIDTEYAKIISKISFGNVSYSLEIAKKFEDKMNNINKIISSLLDDDMSKWKDQFTLLKDKNTIIEYLELLNIFLRDVYNYKSTNNRKVINFTNFGKIVINFSKKYSINFELCSNLINNAINNLNANGYIPLMVTALYIELFQVFENKSSSVLNYQSIVDFN